MQAPQTGKEVIGGRYVVERKLGRGGVGEVLLAWDGHLNRWTAIKRLHHDNESGTQRIEAAMQEAKTLASLQHPNVVTVYDFVWDAEDLVVVMEYVPGRTLEELTAPLTTEDFVDLAFQSLDGLGAAHALGLIHRDIKPGNIMIAEVTGGKFQVKLLDFGLAKIISEPTSQTVHQDDCLLGSIFMMAPEQFELRPLDARTDVYALGCSLYWALTLRNPFQGETVPAVISAHLHHRFEPLATFRPDVPEAIRLWVESLFAAQMEQRPGSARDAALLLRKILEFGLTPQLAPAPQAPALQWTPAPPAAPKTFWHLPAAIAAVIGAVMIAAFFLWRHSSQNPVQAPTTTPEVKESISAAKAPRDLPTFPPSHLPAYHQAAASLFSPSARKEILAQLGKEITVNGTISRAGENKSGTIRFLNFQGTQKGDLSLVFFRSDWKEFDDAMFESYIGKRVRVTGRVSEFEGNPQLVIARESQIQIDR